MNTSTRPRRLPTPGRSFPTRFWVRIVRCILIQIHHRLLHPIPISKMDSGKTPPSFPSKVTHTIDQEQPQVSTTEDVQAFGAPDRNPMAADIYGQPMSYGGFVHGQQNSLNQFQGGSVSRGLDDSGGGWYSNDAQPPSVGAIRPGVISHPSGSNQIYSYGLPPSFNDFDRRETSQTGTSTSGVVPEAYEFAGMSLTGNNFRRFHPDAFNKDKYGK